MLQGPVECIQEAAAQIRGAAEMFWKIQSALERAGVEFIPADATRAGRTPRASLSGRPRQVLGAFEAIRLADPRNYKRGEAIAREAYLTG